jgi:hypothetical protein
MDTKLKIEKTENLLKLSFLGNKERIYIVFVGTGFFRWFDKMSQEVDASKEDENKAYDMLFKLIHDLDIKDMNVEKLKVSILHQMSNAGRQKQKHIQLLSLWSDWFKHLYSVTDAKKAIKIASELATFFDN